MKKSAEYFMNKKVDYFELLANYKPTFQLKIKSNEELEEEITSINKNNKHIVETPAIKIRKAELEAVKAELYLLRTNGFSQVSIMEEHSIKARRAELLYCKKLLRAEFGIDTFSRFNPFF